MWQDFYSVLVSVRHSMEVMLISPILIEVAIISLEKQIGCFDHRVVILVAREIDGGYEMCFFVCVEINCISGSCPIHHTTTTL